MTKVDAVYFGTTVLTTTGFGDISPRSQSARQMVTIQMLVGLVLVVVLGPPLVAQFSAPRLRPPPSGSS